MDLSTKELFLSIFDFIWFLLPIVLPIALVWLGIDMFIAYKKKQYRNGLKWALLEIIPPADVDKSPAGMDLFFHHLHQTGGEGNWWDIYVKGQFRSRFSLELISQGGRIRYFIRTETKHIPMVESGLYAQFPGIEVNMIEDDYADDFDWDPKKYELYGLELELTKKDAYPIKTYVDYSLDRDPDAEYRIDPMAQLVEYLNTVKPGNHFWIQIIIKAHKKEDKDFSKLFPGLAKKKDNWDEEGRKEIEDIRKKAFLEVETKEGGTSLQRQETQGTKEIIAAIERSLTKWSFDVGIRTMNIAKKEDYDKGAKAMKGIWKQFSSLNLNGFKPGHDTDFGWWYQDPFGTRLNVYKEEMLQAYRSRRYFDKERPSLNWGFLFLSESDRKSMVLNTEELATIYHFLGRTSEAPQLSKVDAKKGAPPSNLPI